MLEAATLAVDEVAEVAARVGGGEVMARPGTKGSSEHTFRLELLDVDGHAVCIAESPLGEEAVRRVAERQEDGVPVQRLGSSEEKRHSSGLEARSRCVCQPAGGRCSASP
jgi:hypothetical protein